MWKIIASCGVILASAPVLAGSSDPGSWDRRVNSRSVETFYEEFYGGEPAVVEVRGDGDTDLDLYVYDAAGNQICSGESYDDREVCVWTPRWTDVFTIRVRNLGSVYNHAVVTTN